MYRPKQLIIKNIISHTQTTYVFREGEAVVVVGSNLDDSSQRGNGSGKSALIESVALAFTGTSIRDVKVKELITNNADSGEIELLLYNTRSNQQLTIFRKLYAGSKSAECKIWMGKDEIKLPDINSYNKWIFDEIGLSKEDFFKFFLITSDNYEPFLKVGDLKKKEIINRFSGAETIDSVFPFIKIDSEDIELRKVDLIKQKITSQTRAQTFAEQVIEFEIQLSDEYKKPLLDAKDKELNDLVSELTKAIEIGRDQLRDKLDSAKQLVEKFQYDAQLMVINDRIEHNDEEKLLIQSIVDQLQKQHSDVKGTFDKDIATIDKDERSLKEQLQQIKVELKEYEDFESEVSKKLADSIECPKCAHKFSLRDKEFNVDEAQAVLPDILDDIRNSKEKVETINKDIQQIAARRQDVNDRILNLQQSLNKDIDSHNSKLRTLSEEQVAATREKTAVMTKYNVLQDSVKKAQQEIEDLDRDVELKYKQCELLEKEILSLKDNSDVIKKIEEFNNKIQDEFKVEVKLDQEIDKLEKQLQSTKAWEVNFKNFKSFVANQSIKNISDYTNLFLQNMGTNLAINIDGYKVLSNGKVKEQITTTVLRDGFEAGSYGKFSGGERGRIDICVILAIQELINLNCKSGGLDLTICDEILDQVDGLGLESIINSLQSLGKTVMIVSQNEINALKEYTVTVQKQNRISTIL